MSEYSINFDTLKFNLYEILNISQDASETKIKKAYRNLILHFHPDKNNKTEEEIYYHIITAYEILTNKENRTKYNNYLNKSSLSFEDLKKSYLNNDNNVEYTKEEAINLFEKKKQELNIKHNYNDNYNTENIKNKYDKILKDRETQIQIPKENIGDSNDFNFKFQEKKNNLYSDQIISIQDSKNIISNDNSYTTLDVAFNNLYIEGEDITSSNYTSLSTAFKIQELDTNINNTDIESAIKKYKSDTNIYIDPTFEFTNNKFEKW
jgi:curved DNA-binding protein CbpA